ncbi:MAG: response regulator transcription factor [Pseudomonadota bacterium]
MGVDPISILVVDDDQQLGSMLTALLRSEGFAAEFVPSSEKALTQVSNPSLRLCILDIMMPGMNGLDLLTFIRKQSDVPVLMLTARGDDADRILGFERGADDYVPKPFNPRELLLRVKAILKRTREDQTSEKSLSVGALTLEPRRHEVSLKGTVLPLTGAELRILEALMREAGRVVSRESLTKSALGRSLTAYDRSLDTHMSHLRRKLGADGSGDSPIRSMRGAGYVLIADEWEPPDA